MSFMNFLQDLGRGQSFGNALGQNLDLSGMGSMADRMQDETAGATPEREAMARQMGYRNYEEMMLRERMKRAPSTGTATAPGGAGAMDDLAHGRFGKLAEQGMNNAMNLHPKTLFERVLRAFPGGGQ